MKIKFIIYAVLFVCGILLVGFTSNSDAKLITYIANDSNCPAANIQIAKRYGKYGSFAVVNVCGKKCEYYQWSIFSEDIEKLSCK